MTESSWFKRLWDTFADPISAAVDAPSTVLKPTPPPAGLALQYTLKSRWVSSVTWSPDGRLLASSSDRGVQLWDPRTGRRLCLLKGKSSSVAWSPDGKLLASRSFDVLDRTIRLWDPHTGRRLHTLKDRSRSVAWSPDGKLLASASDALDRTIRLWDPSTGQLLRTLEDQSLSLAWSPDGKILAIVSDDWAVRLWDPHTGQLLCTLEDQSDSVVWSPDGKLLASGNGVWDPSTGQLLYPLMGLTNDVSQTNEINSVAWSPDGELLASGSPGGAVQLWNTHTGQMLRILEGRSFRLYGVAWSPDGRLLAAGSADPGGGRIGSIRLWRADTWESLTDLAAGQNFHLDASWNSRFSFLVITGHLHDIFVWHLDLMRLLQATPSSKVLHSSNAEVVPMANSNGENTSETVVSLLDRLPLSQAMKQKRAGSVQRDQERAAVFQLHTTEKPTQYINISHSSVLEDQTLLLDGENRMDRKEKEMKVDIAIITIRPDEFKAVRSRFQTEERQASSGRTYLMGEVKTHGEQIYTIAIARCSEQGTDVSQRMTHSIIQDLHPQLILVVGIAGGVPHDDFTLGDVVISTHIVNSNVDAWHPDGTTSYATRGSPPHPMVENITNLLPGNPHLAGWTDSISRARPGLDPQQMNIEGDDKWRRQVRESLNWHFGEEENQGRSSLYITGPILSSNHLVKDPVRLRDFLKTYRDIIAVEMETAGVYEAAYRIPPYPVMAIRGISDIVGAERDKRWTAYACHTAGAFTYAFIKTNPLKLRSAPSEAERRSRVKEGPNPIGSPETASLIESFLEWIGKTAAYDRHKGETCSGICKIASHHPVTSREAEKFSDKGVVEGKSTKFWITPIDKDKRSEPTLFACFAKGDIADDLCEFMGKDPVTVTLECIGGLKIAGQNHPAYLIVSCSP